VTNKDAVHVHFHPVNKWNQHGPETDVSHRTTNPFAWHEPSLGAYSKAKSKAIVVKETYQTNIYLFDVHVTVHHDKFLIIKPNRCTNFSNLFLE
jgi:hypothetical protein